MSRAATVKNRMGFLTQMQRYPGDGGWVAGVCVGIADYFGWSLKLVRVVAFLLFLFTVGTVVFVAYIVLWFLMDTGDLRNPNRPRYEDLAQAARPAGFGAASTGDAGANAPSAADIRARFNQLDARLRQMEEAALSKDAALLRELNKLERDSGAPGKS
jgi:phage shock protein C